MSKKSKTLGYFWGIASESPAKACDECKSVGEAGVVPRPTDDEWEVE